MPDLIGHPGGTEGGQVSNPPLPMMGGAILDSRVRRNVGFVYPTAEVMPTAFPRAGVTTRKRLSHMYRTSRVIAIDSY